MNRKLRIFKILKEELVDIGYCDTCSHQNLTSCNESCFNGSHWEIREQYLKNLLNKLYLSLNYKKEEL